MFAQSGSISPHRIHVYRELELIVSDVADKPKRFGEGANCLRLPIEKVLRPQIFTDQPGKNAYSHYILRVGSQE